MNTNYELDDLLSTLFGPSLMKNQNSNLVIKNNAWAIYSYGGLNKENTKISYNSAKDELVIEFEIKDPEYNLDLKNKLSYYGFKIYDMDKTQVSFKDGIIYFKFTPKLNTDSIIKIVG